MQAVEVQPGQGPVVLAMPHTGTWLPQALTPRLNADGLSLRDTDWHIDRLYAGLLPGAAVVKANFHRYLIDANRGPDDASLYPGQNTTGLCPLTDFDGKPLYRPGAEPDAGEIDERRAQYHAPYHAALAEQLQRAVDRHGVALLYDCHSIRSRIPYLFEGELPQFNIGSNSGRSCDPSLLALTAEHCGDAPGYRSVVDGRFKGGWTTRHYGRPEHSVHAIQMELAQRAYLHEAPPLHVVESRAADLRAVLQPLLQALETHVLTLRNSP